MGRVCGGLIGHNDLQCRGQSRAQSKTRTAQPCQRIVQPSQTNLSRAFSVKLVA